MDLSLTNTYPQLCFEVGLTCEGCTAESARQLAQVCKGLRGKVIGHLFVQLYPNSACAPMHRHFVESYRACTEVAEEVPTRKPVVMAMAARAAAAAVA
jgi:hypothetical protein